MRGGSSAGTATRRSASRSLERTELFAALARRDHRHRREGDVHASRTATGPRSRCAPRAPPRWFAPTSSTASDAARTGLEALLSRPDVPPRAAAKGPLPAVLPDRRGGARPRRPARRRGALGDAQRLFLGARPRHRADRNQFARRLELPPRLSGGAAPLRGAHRHALRRLQSSPRDEPAAHPRLQGGLPRRPATRRS